jgi:ubiquinone/menaquinone biosynthesis C-methylase UbiE
MSSNTLLQGREEQLKACCAAAYASEAARFLLGDSFHPGGAELTSRLAAALRVGPGETVVDVASGPGKSAIQVAHETGCDVIGIELSAESVEAAARLAAREGLDGQVRFVCGDAEALLLPDASMDGALCECSLCTFPDKSEAAFELARVLKPGARLGLSDMTAIPERLPPELRSLEAWVACLGGARPVEEIATLLEDAGFLVESTERHDEALAELVERVRERLRAARFLVDDAASRGLELTRAAREAIESGSLGYAVFVARRA